MGALIVVKLETITHTEYLPPLGRRYDKFMHSLSIDGHSILNNKYFADLEWVLKLKQGIEKYFPHLVNLKADDIANHPDSLVLKSYLQHQCEYHTQHKHGSPFCLSSFDDDYNPSHYFNYCISN